ncbi:hypothetical protein ACHAWU_007443 [Discostella pseudostelligera]|uniref:Uncharacterized protein n=1 Tax=Discostella pseudostelligera TaxID=259834 RepID=A0ABD3MS42_9STRA
MNEDKNVSTDTPHHSKDLVQTKRMDETRDKKQENIPGRIHIPLWCIYHEPAHFMHNSPATKMVLCTL